MQGVSEWTLNQDKEDSSFFFSFIFKGKILSV